MFSSKLKIAGWIIVILTIVGLITTYVMRGKEVKALTGEVAVSKVKVGSLTETIVVGDKSAAITEKATVAAVQVSDKIKDQVKAIVKKTEIEVTRVKHTYATQAADPKANHAALAKEASDKISAIRINSLWDTFCATRRDYPITAGCSAIQ